MLYLLTPLLVSIAGIDFVTTLVLAIVLQVPIIPAVVIVRVFFFTLGFGPGFITLFLRGRGLRGFLLAVVEMVPYAAYTWLVFPVFPIALVRHWSGRTGWSKTAREASHGGGDRSALGGTRRRAEPVEPPEDESLAQRPRRDLELVDAERAHRLGEHDGAGDDLERAIGGDAGQGGPRVGGDAGEPRDPVVEPLAA